MLLLQLACTDDPAASAEQDSATPFDSAALPLDPEITQGGDTPVRRVRWSTPEISTGRVEYGVDGLDSVRVDDAVGTDHDVLVAGIPAGTEWQYGHARLAAPA